MLCDILTTLFTLAFISKFLPDKKPSIEPVVIEESPHCSNCGSHRFATVKPVGPIPRGRMS